MIPVLAEEIVVFFARQAWAPRSADRNRVDSWPPSAGEPRNVYRNEPLSRRQGF